MCRWCDTDSDPTLVQLPPQAQSLQRRITQLLPLLETPDALPPADALRISQMILGLLEQFDALLGEDAPCRARLGLPRALAGQAPAFPALQ